jgi:hypothetical protein
VIRLRLSVSGAGARGLRAAAAKLPEQLGTLTQQSAEQTQAALKARAPVSKQRPGGPVPGALRRSIMFDLEGTRATFAASQIADYVIGGTDPHDIEPRSKRALAFFWDRVGDQVVFMRVRHPGTSPNDFRIPALDEAAGQADTLIDALGDEILDTISQ